MRTIAGIHAFDKRGGIVEIDARLKPTTTKGGEASGFAPHLLGAASKRFPQRILNDRGEGASGFGGLSLGFLQQIVGQVKGCSHALKHIKKALKCPYIFYTPARGRV
jgi:hypothetical protein